MEFFQTIQQVDVDAGDLKRLLTLGNLPGLCASIDTSQPRTDHEGEIYCLWGAFNVRRDEIANGVRFSLLDCPHALAWSITCDKASGRIIIHCTIDKTEPEADFVESIALFVRDWADGVSRSFKGSRAEVGAAGVPLDLVGIGS